MSNVVLGNIAVREVIGHEAGEDGQPDTAKPVYRTYTGQAGTTMFLPDSWNEDEKFRQITHETGFWPAMSSAKPVWVESDDDALAQALSYFYGCPVGRPSEWKDGITCDAVLG